MTADKEHIIEISDLSFRYGDEVNGFLALRDINLTIAKGEYVAIMGPSGSGKSTLMNLLGTLATASSGTLRLSGEHIEDLNEEKLASHRNRSIGFVFQQFHLLPRLTILENVLLPLTYRQPVPTTAEIDEARAKAIDLLKSLKIGEQAYKLPALLSGGQKQRAAIARALLLDPDIILADEPTGALDSKTAQDVLNILVELNKRGKTIIVITHDPEVTRVARRRIELRDGRVVGDTSQPGIDSGSTHLLDQPPSPISHTSRIKAWLQRRLSPSRDAWQALTSSRLRTALTSLGLIIGVSSIIIMLTLGTAAQQVIINIFNQAGADRIYVGLDYRKVRSGGFAGFWQGLDVDNDFPELQNTFSEYGRIVPLGNNSSQKFYAAGNQFDARVQPLYSLNEFFDEGLKLDRGRLISPRELQSGARVALVGSEFAEGMFPPQYPGRLTNPRFPLGEILSIRGKLFTHVTIVGVLKKRDTTFDAKEANSDVYIPMSTYNQYTGTRHTTWLAVVPKEGVKHSWIADSVKNYLQLRTGNKYPFRASVPEEQISRIMLFIKVFQGLTALIGGLCILVGGIGIMNIMLVTIAERVREIGLRKALGAPPAAITRQFLLECIMLCAVSGLVGTIGGLGFCNLVGYLSHMAMPDTIPSQFLFYPAGVAFGLGTAILCGVAFGMMPALKAARLDPSEALRSE